MSKTDERSHATIHNNRLDSQFTITANSTPADTSLSWAAKGLLWYLVSQTSDWVCRTDEIAKIYNGNSRGNGQDAIKSIMRELRDARYVIYTKKKLPDGTWTHRYDVYPTPQPEVVEPPVVKPPLILYNKISSSSLLPNPTDSTEEIVVVVASDAQRRRNPIVASEAAIREDKTPAVGNNEEKTPAAGNNNLSAHGKEKKSEKIYPCLIEFGVPGHTKRTITDRYTEAEVCQALKIFTHEASIYAGKGEEETARILQHALKHPGSYKKMADNLGQPKLTKEQQGAKEEEIRASHLKSSIEKNKELVQKFRSGEIYGEWKCRIREDSIEFEGKGFRNVFRVYFNSKTFVEDLKNALQKMQL